MAFDDIFKFPKCDSSHRRAELRTHIVEHIDPFIRGMALSISTILAELGMIATEDAKGVTDSIYALVFNYANLKELASTLVKASDPDGEYSKGIERWKSLPPADKKKALLYMAIMPPDLRRDLLEKFDEGVQSFNGYTVFKPHIALLEKAVEESNAIYEKQYADVDLEALTEAVAFATEMGAYWVQISADVINEER